MLLTLALFDRKFTNVLAISFTSLILNELLMVAYEIRHWCVPTRQNPGTRTADRRRPCNTMATEWRRHVYMIYAEVVTLLVYLASLVFLQDYFGTRPPTQRGKQPTGTNTAAGARLCVGPQT